MPGDLRSIGAEQQIHVFRKSDVALESHRNPTHHDEPDTRLSEQDQQFFERRFHRRSGDAIVRQLMPGR